jgi:hypothetical protein
MQKPSYMDKQSRTVLPAVVGALLILFVWPHPGSAQWQFTQWDQTPTQVVEASAGKAVAMPADEVRRHRRTDGLVPKLKMPWMSGRFRFTAFFYFSADQDRLGFVRLRLDGTGSGDGVDLVEALTLKYGQPVETPTPEERRILVWLNDENRISYRKGPAGEVVTYQPRKTADNAGL